VSELVAEREARRTALILASSQAIVGSAAPIAISIGALAGFYMLGSDKSLATAPVTGFNLGVALGALPAAAIIRSLGQRNGFLTGTLITGIGGLIATLALFQGAFWTFAIGLMVLGCGGAFVQQFRFAAADNAPPEFKARAISFVLAGGVITAILGPQIVIFTRELFAPVMFAGSFASILGLAAVGAVILSFLRVRGTGPERAEVESLPARSLGEIVTQPRFAVALGCAVGSYALMSFVMTGAPLAMVGCGFSPDVLARHGHVRAELLHGAPDPPLRRRDHRGAWPRAAARLRRGGALRHRALAVLDRADPAWPRLEFCLHRRHGNGFRDLPDV